MQLDSSDRMEARAAMHSLARTCVPPARIAFLASLDDAPNRLAPGESWLVRLAQGIATASGSAYSVQLVSCGPNPGRHQISPGVSRRILPAAGPVSDPTQALSWHLPAALAEADLVHLHGCRNRTCEAALGIACHERKPLCISHYEAAPHSLAAELGLFDLAGAVVCHSAELAAALHTAAPLELLPPCGPQTDLGGIAVRLVEVYRRLLESRESACEDSCPQQPLSA